MGRMMLLSLGLHVGIVLLFAGVLLPRFHRQPPPVYYVDLVNLPVPEPQAGRPDARPEPQIKPEAKHRRRCQKPKNRSRNRNRN